MTLNNYTGLAKVNIHLNIFLSYYIQDHHNNSKLISTTHKQHKSSVLTNNYNQFSIQSATT